MVNRRSTKMKSLIKKILVGVAVSIGAASAANAGCGVTSGKVNIIANEFPAIQTVGKGARACDGGGVEVKVNLTSEHQTLHVPGMTGNPPEYTSSIVANSSIVALMNDGLIRPLDEYVNKWGGKLKKSQLITIDGKIMAVAFMANAQHLMYRKDILEKVGAQPPKTYEEVIEIGKKIKDAGIMQYPLTGVFKGWSLGQEFTNMYLGYGGEFFEPGTAEPSVNNQKGVKTLETLKALTELMNPDYLTYDTNAATAEWQAGNAAVMNMWGSRAASLHDSAKSKPEVVQGTEFAGPLTVGGGSTPATTLWWDGFTVAKNIPDEDAEATFRVLVSAIDPKIMSDNEVASQATWLIDGYSPTQYARGTIASAEAGTKPYPMVPFHSLLHTALSAELADFFTGKESAQKVLSDAEAAYRAAAKEKGYLK